MNILFAASEAAPLYKVGGLGDVVGSLPIALNQLGHDVRLVLPKYSQIELTESQWVQSTRFTILFDGVSRFVTVWTGLLPGTNITVYLFAEPTLLSAETTYEQEADKYAMFSLAVSHWLTTGYEEWRPHVTHLHDWHTALIPVILKYKCNFDAIPNLLTIHNLEYQGITSTSVLHKLEIVPQQHAPLIWDGSDGDIDILLQGIIHADYINTVSPTYAKEILTPEYGSGLQTILIGKRKRLKGILNGIDTNVWNPTTDEHLAAMYDTNDWEDARSKNRQALQEELGLDIDPQKIILAFVGRVDGKQKGIQLIIQALKEQSLTGDNKQFIFLGVGDKDLENQLESLSEQIPEFKAVIKYDDGLAHRIYASAHLILIPSRYEPCGLVQMMAMRYGGIPVARQTGGLADTVIDGQTGVIFQNYNTESFKEAIQRAVSIIQDTNLQKQIVQNCMNQDFSWQGTAKEYVSLYNQMLNL